MTLSTHYHSHKPNVPIIMEDVFGWVREGNAFQVRVWLDDTEHDLNLGDDHGFSLLHWASKEGHVNIVEMLVSRGARVNATNMGDDTALHLAAAHGHREIIQKLLAKKSDVNAVNEHGNSPLHYACFWGYEQIAEDLIHAGALLSICNKYGESPVDVCRPQVQKNLNEIAANSGQDLNKKIAFRDQTWKGTKTRSRDATLSRYTGVDISQLNLTTKIAESHSGELWKGKWQGNDIVARILMLRQVTPRISRDFQEEYPTLRIFSHPNVCPVLACCNQPPNLVVVSQFMPFGSLYNILHEQSGVLGIKVKIMLPHDPKGQMGPKKPLPDHIQIAEPKDDTVPSQPYSEHKGEKKPDMGGVAPPASVPVHIPQAAY
uniref:Serine-threonine/tyrosine-protein kinase catalytic domain-containing protein n=1 Tax=Plectus sambesii TaxID=2011161 RepID=A0A914VHF1_9BILA